MAARSEVSIDAGKVQVFRAKLTPPKNDAMQKANITDYDQRHASAAATVQPRSAVSAASGCEEAALHELSIRSEIAPDRLHWETELFVLRGESRRDLTDRTGELRTYLGSNPNVPLKDLAATLNTPLEKGGSRLCVVARSVDELVKRLDRANERLTDSTCHQIVDAAGIYYCEKPLYERGRVALLFPGEGAQYVSMLGDLCPHFPEVHGWLARSDEVLSHHSGASRPTSRFMLLDEDVGPQQRAELERDLAQLDNTMSSVLTADWALYLLVQNLGLEGDVVAGHSVGELAALSAAGCISNEAEMALAPAMLRALQEGDDDGEHTRSVLLAVGASREAMERLVQDVVADKTSDPLDAEVFLAMDNCPHQTILVGSPAVMAIVEAELKVRHLMYERLPFDRPYHTHLFEPFMGPLAEMFDAVSFSPSDMPIYSCTTARPFPRDPDEICRLALAHWASPVCFTEMIRAMHAAGVRIFVEVGPKGNLSSFVSDILRGEEFLAVPANVERRSGLTQLNHLAAQLAAHHVPLELDHLYRRRNPQFVDWRDRDDSVLAPSVAQKRPDSKRDAAMARYWSVMEQFLEDQRDITEAYLRRRTSRSPISIKSTRVPREAMALPTAAAGRSTASPVATPPHRSAVQKEPQPPLPRLPLIGEIVRHEPAGEIVMRRRLVLDEDVYAGEHTVGGREVSKVDPSQHGLPIMPMTFTLEIMAEVASLLVPGKHVLGLRDVQLQRWLAFDEKDAATIEVTARVAETPKDPEPGATSFVRVEVKDLGSAVAPTPGSGLTAAAGTVLLGERYPEPPALDEEPLNNAHEPRVSIEQMYQNLFHGPQFQGIFALDQTGDNGIHARLRVLPRDRLFKSNPDPQFIIDPVTIDVSMHPSAGWHLEQPDQSGRILLPFELKGIYLYGPAPAVGAEFQIRSRVAHTSSRHFSHDGDVIDPQGRAWCRLRGVKSWRFYVPFAEVNFHGPKDEYFLTTDWPRAVGPPELQIDAEQTGKGFGGLEAPPDASVWCVRLTPSPDLLQPALVPAAARVTLSPTEQEKFRTLGGTHAQRAAWLFSHAAAKDAVRILWRLRHGERLFPADIEIDTDDYGRPMASLRGSKRPVDFPAVSFAQADDFMAGIAALDSAVGIDLMSLAAISPEEEFSSFDASERSLIDELDGDRGAWIARFACAKAALTKALGPKLVGESTHLAVRSADQQDGTLRIALAAELASMFPELLGRLVIVQTLCEDNVIVATTLCQSDTL